MDYHNVHIFINTKLIINVSNRLVNLKTMITAYFKYEGCYYIEVIKKTNYFNANIQ